MSRGKVVRGEGETRQRILAAAVARFAGASYDAVGLREIAADVGVDVAYVHRCFGSKEKLFAEVLLTAADGPPWRPGPDGLAAALAGRVADPAPGAASRVDPLTLLVCSAASDKAKRLIGERVQSDFLEPIRALLGDSTQVRASMILSVLLGYSILQHLLHLPVVADLAPDKAEALVAKVLDGVMRVTASETGEDG